MSVIEDLSTDARSADGYVVLFKIAKPLMTGVLVVLATSPSAVSLRKLTKAISAHPRLHEQLEGYQTERRGSPEEYTYEIKFAVLSTGIEGVIREFLEYARQACVLKKPIICDMRDFNPG